MQKKYMYMLIINIIKKIFHTAAHSAMPIDPRKLLIGIFVVELNDKKQNRSTIFYKRPNVEIIINDKNYFKTNW